MSVKDEVLTVGFDKNGEADFGIRCDVEELSYAQMNQLRQMIIVAIGTMEQIWRDERARKYAVDHTNVQIRLAIAKGKKA